MQSDAGVKANNNEYSFCQNSVLNEKVRQQFFSDSIIDHLLEGFLCVKKNRMIGREFDLQ